MGGTGDEGSDTPRFVATYTQAIVEGTDDGRLFLQGDGTATTDSRDFGAIAPDRVIGVVRCTSP